MSSFGVDIDPQNWPFLFNFAYYRVQYFFNSASCSGPNCTKGGNSGGVNKLRMSSKFICRLDIYVLIGNWFVLIILHNVVVWPTLLGYLGGWSKLFIEGCKECGKRFWHILKVISITSHLTFKVAGYNLRVWAWPCSFSVCFLLYSLSTSNKKKKKIRNLITFPKQRKMPI